MSKFGIKTRALFLVVSLLLCTGSAALAQTETPEVTPTETSAEPCADGMMRIRDLAGADASMLQGIQTARQQASEWEKDSRLVALQLRCPLLEPGYQWEGTYFSEEAQSYWKSSTRETTAADDNPLDVRTLVVDGISFQNLQFTLLRAGYSPDLVINVSTGVTVRYNTRQNPFGPPETPVNVVMYHLAIEDRGEIKDIWVSSDDDTIYRYT